MLSYTEGRIVVPDEEDRGVIPAEWLESYGRALLPACWTAERWHTLDKQSKRFVYRSVVSLPYYFWHVYMPFKSKMEMGYSEERLREIYPKGPPDFWIKYLRDLQAAIPYELIASERKPEHNPIWRLGRSEPTGHFKSARTCEALPLWLIGINPPVTMLIATSTKDVGDRYISAHKAHITRNERYQWVFGHLHSDKSDRVWRTDALEVDHPLSRSSHTVEIIGYQGDIEGERYDLGIGDDIATFENAKTPYAREQQWTWMTGTMLRRLNGDRRFFIYIGTPHWGGDLLDRIKTEAATKGTWDYQETKAILSGTWPPARQDPTADYSRDNVVVPRDCQVLWPEFWSVERLVEDFLEDPNAFARTRMLVHQDPDSKWFTHALVEDMKADGGVRLSDGSPRPLLSRWPEDIGLPGPDTALYEQYTSQGFDVEGMRRVISVDLATEEPTGERHDPDYTVLQLWGMDKASYARLLLNQRRRRTRDPKVIGQMLSQWVQAYNPHKLLVEAVAVDRLFARTLQDVVGFPVQIADPKRDKLDRIERLRDLIQAGMVWVPFAHDAFRGNYGRNYNTRFVMQPFLDELEAYPRGNAHNDTLMAAVHAMSELRGGEGQIRAHLVGGEPEGPRGLPGVRTLKRLAGRGGANAKLKDDIARVRQMVGRLKMRQLAGPAEQSEEQKGTGEAAGISGGGQ